jgi:hypothetical protein
MPYRRHDEARRDEAPPMSPAPKRDPEEERPRVPDAASERSAEQSLLGVRSASRTAFLAGARLRFAAVVVCDAALAIGNGDHSGDGVRGHFFVSGNGDESRPPVP